MENTNMIKVTVEYTTPKTDKFTALLSQYDEVKKTAQETIDYYRPLADMAEETKLLAILEQLGTIKEYLWALNGINPHIKEVYITSYNYSSYDNGKVSLRIVDNKILVYWHSHLFSVDYYRKNKWAFTDGEYMNILGNWDKWEVYKKLETACLRMLKREVENQKAAAEKQIARLKNIIE